MRNSIANGNGDSRYMKSAIPENITHEELVALLREGVFPFDFNGINPAGFAQLGQGLTKENLLDDNTEVEIWGDNADRTINQAFLRLSVSKGGEWKWIDTIDNTKGYSGTWTAPDVFGDGSAYDLGVYMIGGGGSGGAGATSRKPGASDSSYNATPSASGGASGYGKNIIIENVVPGTVFSWVVGAKGVAVTASAAAGSNAAKNGNNGGATSFGGETAEGGEGGRGSANWGYGNHDVTGAKGGQGSDGTPGINSAQTRTLYGGVPTNETSNSPQISREGQNVFDPFMITLAAGGGAYSTNGKQTMVALPDGTKGGNAAASSSNATATAATGYGNGGGAASSYLSTAESARTAKSGAGSDGVIFLYAKAKRSVTSE